uniref:Uncharacterized protein n=1 Tax=Globodera pallida TaxID=36090 RepID=A0A183BP45_GLOPA
MAQSDDTMPQQKVNSRTFYAENPLDDAIAYIHQTRRDNNASKATNNHAYQQPADPVAYAKQNQMRQPAGTKANIPNSGIKFPSPGHRRSPVHAGGSNRTRGKKPLLAHQKAQKNRALLMNSPPPLPSAEAVLHQSRQHAENNQSQRARHNSTKKVPCRRLSQLGGWQFLALPRQFG